MLSVNLPLQSHLIPEFQQKLCLSITFDVTSEVPSLKISYCTIMRAISLINYRASFSLIFSLWLSSTRKWTDDVGRDRVWPAWRPVSLPAQCDRSTMRPVQTRELEHWQWNRWVPVTQFDPRAKESIPKSKTQKCGENHAVTIVECSKSSASEPSANKPPQVYCHISFTEQTISLTEFWKIRNFTSHWGVKNLFSGNLQDNQGIGISSPILRLFLDILE